jgi:hypothetical protein
VAKFEKSHRRHQRNRRPADRVDGNRRQTRR